MIAGNGDGITTFNLFLLRSDLDLSTNKAYKYSENGNDKLLIKELKVIDPLTAFAAYFNQNKN